MSKKMNWGRANKRGPFERFFMEEAPDPVVVPVWYPLHHLALRYTKA